MPLVPQIFSSSFSAYLYCRVQILRRYRPPPHRHRGGSLALTLTMGFLVQFGVYFGPAASGTGLVDPNCVGGEWS